MSDQVPALKAPLDDLVEVVKAADDDRPVETIDMDAYDRAEAAYQKNTGPNAERLNNIFQDRGEIRFWG
ncbi:hypothetical protein HML84_15020 [Alcanivorax sp. IO_7]|nr:hypothetical protein HML84_15020 [Alcanivorax sp. IO_7]